MQPQSITAEKRTDGPAWYAVWTRSRHEKVVREELASKGIEHFLPTIKTVNQWKDRKQQVEVPLFPGYCFARIGLEDRIRVLESRGVIQLVGNGPRPIPIPDDEIEHLRRLMGSDLLYEYGRYERKGVEVEVIHGPLQGVRGSLIRMASKCRLVIAVRLIEQAAVVDIDAGSVIALDGPLAVARPAAPLGAHPRQQVCTTV